MYKRKVIQRPLGSPLQVSKIFPYYYINKNLVAHLYRIANHRKCNISLIAQKFGRKVGLTPGWFLYTDFKITSNA